MKKIKEMKNTTSLPFIFTKEVEVKDLLLKNGFTLLSETNENYMFVNDGKLIFSSEEDEDKYKTKMVYTNKMFM